MKYKLSNKIFQVILFAILSLCIACDGNVPTADSLSPDNSVSVSDLTADKNPINIGESTIIRWDVSDTNGKVSLVQITPDIGPVGTSGSKQVTPKKTTTYVVSVLVDNKIVRTRSIQISVLGSGGTEILETPDDEVCDDGADNDFDGFTDCDDIDCNEDAACIVPPTVYEFYQLPEVPEMATIGMPIDLTWDSNFSFVLASHGNFEDQFEASDTYSFTPATTNTTIKLTGYAPNGYQEVKFVYITATPPPADAPIVSTIVFDFVEIQPSYNLIYGEPYSIEWSVSGYETLTLDGAPAVESGLNINYEAGVFPTTDNSFFKHVLLATDSLGLERSRELRITINRFSEPPVDYFSGNIRHMVNGQNEGEYYIITSAAVYKTNDSFTTPLTEVVNVSELTGEDVIANTTNNNAGNIRSFLAASDGSFYIGTSRGLYQKTSAGVKQLASTGTVQSYATVKALTEMADGKIILGTNFALFEVFSNSNLPAGLGVRIFENSGFIGDVNFYRLISSPSHPNRIIAITDSGVFHINSSSATNSSSFSATSLDAGDQIKDGFWTRSLGLLVWSDSKVYRWSNSTENFTPVFDLNGEAVINFAYKKGERYFVATDNGVYSLNTHETNADPSLKRIFRTNLTDSTKLLIEDTSESSFSNKVKAITSEGLKSNLEWNRYYFKLGLFGTQVR